MSLTHLKVRNFRNLSSVDLEFSAGINLFFGPNAQGKTAVLEAVAYLATSTSHRTRRDDDLIRWGQEAAYAHGTLDGENEDSVDSLEFGLSRSGKQVKVAGAVLKRIRDLYGHLRVVLFVPEDLEIVCGSPAERRRFVDLMVAQLDPEHISQLQRYLQVLRSRNQLLKRSGDGRLDPVELDVWDEQAIAAALPVIVARARAVAELSDGLEHFSKRITGQRERIDIQYLCSISTGEAQSLQDAFNERLIATRQRDMQLRSTSLGPHRDDLQFTVEDKDLRTFGSQGQKRTGVLALRLAELQWLTQKTGQQPVMLLDDVIYEMDEARRGHFFEEIEKAGQVLITATETEHLAPLVPKAKLFKVTDGQVEEVH